MLPYAMLMIELRLSVGERVYTAAKELYSDGVVFDFPASQPDKQHVEECVFYFLDYSHKCYRRICLPFPQLVRVGLRDRTIEYRLITKEPEFIAALQRLSADYVHYIDLKQRGDLIMMEKMTDLSFAEDHFPESAAAWKKWAVGDPVSEDYSLQPVEIAISLDMPHLWQEFLHMEWETFLREYWVENALSDHPIARQKVTHIYIGSQFCEFLLPDKETLYELLEKAGKLGLVPVIALPPMRTCWEERYSDRIRCICLYAETNCRCLELVINDVGTARLVQKLAETGKIRQGTCSLTAGILLNKRKKDFRIQYRSCSDAEQFVYKETAMDAGFYRTYLRDQLGIGRISYEVCGYPIRIGSKDAVLHLPLYQMNTAGYCTLRALCRYGDRSHQKKESCCSAECEKYSVLYPDGLPMTGFGNSLFGCSMKELNDAAMLNAMIRDGVGRLVIRL